MPLPPCLRRLLSYFITAIRYATLADTMPLLLMLIRLRDVVICARRRDMLPRLRAIERAALMLLRA